MDNWQKELSLWCPNLKVLNYYGSQDERRHMRLQIVQELIEYDVILTTYNMVISSADDRVLFRKLDFHYVIFDEAHMLKNMATSRYENLMRVQASRKLLLTGKNSWTWTKLHSAPEGSRGAPECSRVLQSDPISAAPHHKI